MVQLKNQWLFELDEFRESKNRKVHVHTIQMGDVEDPEIYIADPIYEWQQTGKGKWIMEHSNPAPSYHQYIDQVIYGYKYYICAYLNEKDYIYYRLKFV